MQQLLLQITRRLMRRPAAPYHEHRVRAEVQDICSEHGLDCDQDVFGNLLVRLQTADGRRPLALAAHLDHPGFEILKQLSPKRFLARFRGGVGEAYFRRGVPVRLMPGGVPAKLGPRKGKARTFEFIASAISSQPPGFAVWELEDFSIRRGRIHGRACDDLVGVAAVLATMVQLKRARAGVHVIGVLTRAEEVGFHGALALAAARGLSEDTLVVSLETSRELPGVKMGQGVILRVGDRASVFDSAGTRFLAEVASGMKVKKKFGFQHALMSGGTCEATAYQEFGYQAAALCVALGNYHNCGADNRIRAEYVSLADACGMVDLLVAAAKQMPNYPRLTGKLPQRLERLRREAEGRLRQTATSRNLPA